MEELAAFRDPVKASEEAGREDVKGGEGETRRIYQVFEKASELEN